MRLAVHLTSRCSIVAVGDVHVVDLNRLLLTISNSFLLYYQCYCSLTLYIQTSEGYLWIIEASIGRSLLRRGLLRRAGRHDKLRTVTLRTRAAISGRVRCGRGGCGLGLDIRSGRGRRRVLIGRGPVRVDRGRHLARHEL